MSFGFWKVSRRGPLAKVRPSSRRVLNLETLEDRDTPSLLGGQVHLNTATARGQFDTVTASSVNGSRVAVWVHDVTATNQDLRAQRFDAAGNKVGAELVLADEATPERAPSVAMDNSGNFYVAYTRQTSSTNDDVLVRRFSASGTPASAPIQVAISPRREYDPSIACNRTGSIVVSFTRNFSPNDPDIAANVYSSTGVLQKALSIANSGSRKETNSYVARSVGTSNGNFSIAYMVNGKDIFVKRFNSAGNFLDTHSLAVTSAVETNPSVAMDFAGNTVVAYQSRTSSQSDIFARKISRTGVLSVPFAIRTGTSDETDPTVAMDFSDGDFVVAYQLKSPTLTTRNLFVTEVASTGKVRRSLSLASGVTTAVTRPAISISGTDQYFVGFTLANVSSDPGFGVFGRRGIL